MLNSRARYIGMSKTKRVSLNGRHLDVGEVYHLKISGGRWYIDKKHNAISTRNNIDMNVFINIPGADYLNHDSYVNEYLGDMAGYINIDDILKDWEFVDVVIEHSVNGGVNKMKKTLMNMINRDMKISNILS